MYFERWGLLTPPPGKASVPKNLFAQLSPQGYYTPEMTSVQLAAFWRAGVQETDQSTSRIFYSQTVPLSLYEKHYHPDIFKLLDKQKRCSLENRLPVVAESVPTRYRETT
jgi:hypothetical protein